MNVCRSIILTPMGFGSWEFFMAFSKRRAFINKKNYNCVGVTFYKTHLFDLGVSFCSTTDNSSFLFDLIDFIPKNLLFFGIFSNRSVQSWSAWKSMQHLVWQASNSFSIIFVQLGITLLKNNDPNLSSSAGLGKDRLVFGVDWNEVIHNDLMKNASKNDSGHVNSVWIHFKRRENVFDSEIVFC